jgi:tRNA threonylcarbamoyladenosine biosynthesis protein TsaB
MLTLAIDCCAHLCAVAIHDNQTGQILAETSEDIGRGHAEILIPMIDMALAEAKAGYADLHQICAIAGPGSFTGIRVGLAAARGLALGLKVPAYGISRMAGLYHAALTDSHTAENNPNILVVIDARRSEAYCEYFGVGGNFPPGIFVADLDKVARLLAENSALNVHLCGNAAPMIARLSEEKTILRTFATPPVGLLARLAATYPHLRLLPEPIYLRDADAKPQSGFVIARA